VDNEDKMKCPFDKKCEDCKFNVKMWKHAPDKESEEVNECAFVMNTILLAEISAKLNKEIK